jgi:hypothetical protein
VEEPPVLTTNVAKTAPLKAGSISEPAEAEKISVPLVKQEQEQVRVKRPALTLVYSGKKWRRQPRPEDVGSAAATKNHSKGASETPAANQKAQTTAAAENENAGSKKQKTMDTRFSLRKLNSGSCLAAKTPETGNSSSAAKTQKAGNSSSAAKTPKNGNSSSAAKTSKTGDFSGGNKQAAGTSSAAAKKARTGNSFPDVKKQAAGKSSVPARMEMSENIPTNMRIEKAILVEVNSRRSQRVRKPKVY